MSQVIVTNDKLKNKREASKAQEKRIASEAMFARWRRNDITGKDPVTAMIGLAVTPILAFWSLLTGLIYLMMTVLRYVFRAFGQILGGKKSLITGK